VQVNKAGAIAHTDTSAGFVTNSQGDPCKDTLGNVAAGGSRLSPNLSHCRLQIVRIHELVWPQDRIDHIAKHRVQPAEVEEVCFGKAWVRRAKATGKNPVYYVLGQTEFGRHLFCVVIQLPNGKGFPVTARAMTEKEKRQFNRWKKR